LRQWRSPRAKAPILPLITAADLAPFCVTERHLCVDTTASGGNASLLARGMTGAPPFHPGKKLRG
jgi:RHH-type proline utilization regulon transcriptional repressor/proline dehydrogenase/delta 1-pyrroline-5-carboxylate dehydrogenase